MALNKREMRRITYEDELKLTQVAHWRQTKQTLLQVDEEVVAWTLLKIRLRVSQLCVALTDLDFEPVWR